VVEVDAVTGAIDGQGEAARAGDVELHGLAGARAAQDRAHEAANAVDLDVDGGGRPVVFGR